MIGTAAGGSRPYTTVRLCTETALRELDVCYEPLPSGEKGTPHWPTSAAGRATHPTHCETGCCSVSKRRFTRPGPLRPARSWTSLHGRHHLRRRTQRVRVRAASTGPLGLRCGGAELHRTVDHRRQLAHHGGRRPSIESCHQSNQP
ncbi:hypothetical protein [Streptomyces sp. NPDC048057]|uniref:hypothetical protein n=1 Tax=Streptomyces sp. NPDC048057 TaxID=3155628 RepID=UPI0033F18441